MPIAVRLLVFTLCLIGWVLPVAAATTEQPPNASRVLAQMKKAATFYRSQVAVRGGYVYFYSSDLKQRFGEGVASPEQIWVQPPGTPTVGMAFLDAYEATSDSFYLDAATEAATALIYGQLQSGGWTNCIDFNPQGERVAFYRNGHGKGKNNSSLDDDQTQSALRFLMRLDKTYNFENKAIHTAAMTGLDALLAAQFPNGAFPQVWTGPVDSSLPVVPASYPDYDWKTEGRVKNYWDMYTLNDGLAGSVTEVLLDANEIYKDPRYLEAAKKLGDFLILAQMPDPQPGWAQQYSYDMKPIWARKFEPPAIAGRESVDAMDALLSIFQVTRDRKYLDPCGKGIAYLESSKLPNGQLARYYELKTNHPLYMNREGKNYVLTYDDTNLPDHYGWKTDSKVAYLKDRTNRVLKLPRQYGSRRSVSVSDVNRILKSLDSEGRWITTFKDERLVGDQRFKPGDQFISSETFADNLVDLSTYLKSIN
ncbi:pectate lyase [Bremerella sp. JC817]|uniref:pectate lyase n=1 Tax=Bremerella sp. JC817 TaxID=3231756 RepID=UPI003459DFF2